MRREPEVPEEEVPVEECFVGHARTTSEELAPIHSVKSGTLQNACSTRPRAIADLKKSARMHIVKLMNNLVKGKNDDKCSCHVEEEWSQEETECQEQGAREAAWKLAKSVLQLKEHERATFFSPSENRCLPGSTLKPEERDFVVDSGASMHMISKKDLSNADMDTLTKSRSPTIVITANGEGQTHEEATVYVKELGALLTMKVLKETSALFAMKNGYSYEWINGQKPHFIEDGTPIQCNTENFVPIVVPGLSASSSSGSDRSTSRTHSRQESHCSTSSSSASPTVSDTQTLEREDRIESDISPVTVSTTVDDRSERPVVDQANQNPKTK